MIVLNALNVKGAILISILAITLIGIPCGVTQISGVAAVPDFSDLSNVMLNFDLSNVFTASGLILVFVCFFGDFFSTLGTVLAVAGRANMCLDENGNLPGIERPFLVDAIGTCVGALTGNTTVTTFVESTSGVEAGGRSGLTSLVTGVMFLLTVFLAPLFVAIPYCATGPALIYVGFLMLKGLCRYRLLQLRRVHSSLRHAHVHRLHRQHHERSRRGHNRSRPCQARQRAAPKDVHPIMYVLCALMVLYFIVG